MQKMCSNGTQAQALSNKYYIKTHIRLGNFRCNCTRGQLNNKKGEQLHEIKRGSRQTGIGKKNNKTKSNQISFEVTRTWDCFTT